MSASFNKVIIAGNLTRDVELRHIPSGTAVADVTVAVNDHRKQGDEYIEEVHFIDVTLWARNAEVVAEYCQKGSPVLIEGKLNLDRWENKEGEKRSKLKVVAQTVQLLGSRRDRDEAASQAPQAAAPTGGPDNEIPF